MLGNPTVKKKHIVLKHCTLYRLWVGLKRFTKQIARFSLRTIKIVKPLTLIILKTHTLYTRVTGG